MGAHEPGTSSSRVSADPPRLFGWQRTACDLLFLALLWSLAVFIVRPIGDFPLNDDWAWGKTARDLAAGKGYHPSSWTEMTLFTHALWGALFCLPHGFSFTALRCSTLAMSLTGIFAMYALIRLLQPSRIVALGAALTLAFNPIYFALSHTYMADVPFTTLLLGAAIFFVRHLQSEQRLDLGLATAFAVAATLSRQMGLCLPVAFGLALWLRQGFQRRTLVRMILPLSICGLALLGFQFWQKATGQAPANTLRTERLWSVLHNPLRLPVNVAYYGWGMLMYLGWFLAPVIVLLTGRPAGSSPKSAPGLAVRVMLLGFSLVTVGCLGLRRALMPVHNNIIVPEGIGPLTLRDEFDFHLHHLPALPATFWVIITLVSLSGAGFLVWKLTQTLVGLFPNRRFRSGDGPAVVGMFFLLCAAIYLLPFLLSGYFDRYLLPVLVLLIAGLAVFTTKPAPGFSSWQLGGAVLLILVAAIYSVAGTRDYLEWNRIRWQILQTTLAENKLSPEAVDGGIEFNRWHFYDNLNMASDWELKTPYLITFGPMPDCEVVARSNYSQWLPPRESSIFVLRRTKMP